MTMIRSALILTVCVLAPCVAAQKIVQVVRPVRAELHQKGAMPGHIVADQRLALEARVTGYLGEVPVDHGSVVKRGDLLARIAVPDIEAQQDRATAALAAAAAGIGDATAALALARAQVDDAKASLEVAMTRVTLDAIHAQRVRKLAEQGHATPQDRDEAEGALAMAQARARSADAAVATASAAVAAAQARVTSAEAMHRSRAAELGAVVVELGFATLRCPFERAVVSMRKLDPGALVRADEDVILELARVDRVRAEFRVPERDAMRIVVGTVVDLRFDAWPDEPRQATVSRAAGALSRSKTRLVQVDLDNGDGRLLPGMFVHGSLLFGSAEDTLTVPARALQQDDAGAYVLVADAGKAVRVAVEVAADNGIRSSIRAGLSGDEMVITGGGAKAGDAVRVPEARK